MAIVKKSSLNFNSSVFRSTKYAVAGVWGKDTGLFFFPFAANSDKFGLELLNSDAEPVDDVWRLPCNHFSNTQH